MAETSIADCLRQVGVGEGDLLRCASLEDEFRVIKKAYFKKILRSFESDEQYSKSLS